MIFLTAPDALADEGKGADGTAQVKYRQAIAAFEQKNWDEARRLLLELWQQGATYDVAISLVQVEYKLEHFAAAARYLNFALAHVPPTESVANLEQYKANMAELEKVVGSARLIVSETGADLYVDAELVGQSPLAEKIFLDVGKHTVEARRGTDVATQTIDVLGGSTQDVHLTLPQASAEPQPSSSGPARATKKPDADAGDNGKGILPAVIGGSVAVVGLGMFVGFAIAAGSDDDRISELANEHGGSGCATAPRPPECDEQQEAVESYDRNRNWSTAGAVIAGTAIVGTAAYYLFWPDPSGTTTTGRAKSFRWGATVTPDDAGIWVHTSF